MKKYYMVEGPVDFAIFYTIDNVWYILINGDITFPNEVFNGIMDLAILDAWKDPKFTWTNITEEMAKEIIFLKKL